MHKELSATTFTDHEDPQPLDGLVTRAAQGEASAWEAIVSRFSGLIQVIASGYRLSPADTEDVAQTVWLRLFEHLADLREPRALPGWIRTTTAHECVRAATGGRRTVSVDLLGAVALEHAGYVAQSGQAASGDLDEELLRDESRRAVLSGLSELPPRQRVLLLMLAQNPPLPYHEIAKRLGIAVGSIGPTRARGLKKLRETPAVREVTAEPEGSAA